MAEVVWSDQALQDLEAIHEIIAADKPRAAEAFARTLFEAGDSLQRLPRRGRPAPNATRELTAVWPYIIRYDFDEARDLVTIITIWHGARETP
ncbi:MAG TPA: type II toxin-antitoxin system RelE/ParE family toxin [Phenylobacterium sp.]